MWTFILVCLIIPSGLEGAPSDPESGLYTLFHLRRLFLLEDVDDDSYVEYSDIYQIFLRADVNRDGVYSEEEMKNDPDFNEANTKELKVWDVDGDGIVTMKDVNLKFHDKLSAAGNDVNMYEYIVYMAGGEPDEGETVKISAFVTAVKNFEVSDMDDSGCLSKFEYETEFRFADDNMDEILQKKEMDAFRPARFVIPENICPDALCAGCTKKEVMDLFDLANTKEPGCLSLEESVTFFVKRM